MYYFVKYIMEIIVTGIFITVYFLTTSQSIGSYVPSELVTWEEAAGICKKNNSSISDNITDITRRIRNREYDFWLPQYTAITPWIGLVGCVNIDGIHYNTKTDNVSFGICYILCTMSSIFAYKGNVCFCLQSDILSIVNKVSCNMNSEEAKEFLVYKVITDSFENIKSGTCRIGKCRNQAPHMPTYVPDFESYRASACNGGYNIAVKCRSGARGNNGVTKLTAEQNCQQHNSSMLPFNLSSFCAINGMNAQFKFWLAVTRKTFRNEMQFEDPIPVSKSLLNCRCGWFGNGSYKTKDCDCNVRNNVFCAIEATTPVSNHSVSRRVALTQGERPTTMKPSSKHTKSRAESTTKRMIFKQNKDLSPSSLHEPQKTTTKPPIGITENENKTGNKKIGPLAGGVTGGALLLGIVLVIVVLLRKRFGVNKEQNAPEFVQKRNCPIIDNILSTNMTISNQNDGEEPHKLELHNVYANVNKQRSDIQGKSENELTYVDLPEGEYDRLGNMLVRKIDTVCDMYDTGMGSNYDSYGNISSDINDIYDTSYNTGSNEYSSYPSSGLSIRKEINSEDNYDHFMLT